MSLRLEIFLILIVVLFIVFIFFRIKSNKLNLRYSLLWLFAAFITLLCVFNEKFLSKLADLLGIETVSNMIFLFGLVILVALTFALTTIVSLQNRKITTLVQEIGILKKELRGKKND